MEGRRHLDPGRIQLSRVGSIVGSYHYPIRGRGSSYTSQSEAGILLLGVFGLVLIPGAGTRIFSKKSNVLHLNILNIEFIKSFPYQTTSLVNLVVESSCFSKLSDVWGVATSSRCARTL